MSVFHQAVREHIECGDVHAIFFNIFNILKFIILAKGSICTWDQNCISKNFVGLATFMW
jgi:hypothetical protein